MGICSPIRRLFRIDWARTAPGPQVYHRFQQSLYLREPNGRLRRVLWESEWETYGKWQTRRLRATDRRGCSATFCPTLRDRRKEKRPRRNRLRCEYCHEVFLSPSTVPLHSHCPARFKIQSLGLDVIVALLRKKAWTRTTEIDKLRDILFDSLTEQAYRQCLEEFGPASLFYEPTFSEAENLEHYRLYRFASFVDFLRPGEIDWITPSFSDMRIVRHMAARFLALPVGPQRKVIRQLLAGRVHLQTLAGLREKNRAVA